MHRTTPRLRRLTAVLFGTALVLGAEFIPSNAIAQPTAAASDSLQRQIDHQMRTIPGGVQVSDNAVAYKGGEVIVVFPSPGQRTAPLGLGSNVRPIAAKMANKAMRPSASWDYKGCPYGISTYWYCFYTDANFGGRRLQFASTVADKASNWGFDNMTSSWVNTDNFYKTYTYATDSYGYPLWTESAGMAAVSYVGDGYNDAMSSWVRVHK